MSGELCVVCLCPGTTPGVEVKVDAIQGGQDQPSAQGGLDSLLGASSGKPALPSFLLLLLLLSSCSVQHSSRSSRSSHLPLIRASSAGARPSVPIVLYPDVLADGFFPTDVSQVE